MAYNRSRFIFDPKKARRSFILESHFDFYNEKFFRGSLPKTKVYWYRFPKHRRYGCTAFTKEGEPWFICINAWLEKAGTAFALSTLLHEQIHVKYSRAAHGPVFQKEKRRLIRAGAFDDLI